MNRNPAFTQNDILRATSITPAQSRPLVIVTCTPVSIEAIDSKFKEQTGYSPGKSPKNISATHICVFRLLFTLVFAGRNLFRTLEIADGTCDMAKDKGYRFLNSVHTNAYRHRSSYQRSKASPENHLQATLFEQTLTAVMGISKEPIHSLMDRFLDELPPIYRTRLLFPWRNNPVPC